ncbi:MAG: hypothetical protein IJX96_00950 [Clostridia bacterium]|nr:hypothetical protein [Clostridia bacterium]
MKKKLLLSLSILAFTATVVPFAAKSVAADESTQKDILVLPSTYEEYLPLTAPTDVAVSENHTAIADGNHIYIYDRAEDKYEVFKHEQAGIATQDEVKKLQFAANGKLYYADSSSGDNFYELNIHDFTTTKFEDIACDTFVIHDQELYFAGPTGVLYSTSLADYDAPKTPVCLQSSPRDPVLAFWMGELYFTDNGAMQSLYKLDTSSETPTQVTTFSEPIEHMSIHGEVFACTTTAGNFYTYALSDLSQQTKQVKTEDKTGNYSALAAYEGYFYAIKGSAVRQYSLQDHAFTSFEICSRSDSVNRLDRAQEIFLAKDKLFVADNGNDRISVYDRTTGAFETPVPTEIDALYLAANENTLLAANAEKAILYDLHTESYGAPLLSFENFNGNIVGVAEVYGKYYLATDKAQFYALTKGEEWTLTTRGEKAVPAPKALAADAYGNLYVLTSSNIHRYAEEEFIDPTKEGEKLNLSIPFDTTEIVVDYHQTVYALSQNSLYNLTAQTESSFATPLVYPETQTASVISVAFGIEENETYLLCDGTYLIRSARLHLPTVKTIEVNGADEKVFESAEAEFTVVQTKKNALLVEFELQTLQGEEYFPYLGLERDETQKTALVIGEADGYYLLAVFDETQNHYRTYLALKTACEPLATEDYRTEYTDSERRTGYLTNAIALYKFPYLTELLTAGELARGAEVTLLGEIDELDHAYYHISYTNETGETVTGYIPQSYANDFSGLPPINETLEVGETESDRDSVFRLAYLILGFAAICILADYLILKKKGGND